MPKISRTEREFIVGSEEMEGHCLGCGTEQSMCEPDCRKRKCEECGEFKVYGLDALLEIDMIEFTELGA